MVLTEVPRPTALWVVPVSDIGGVARHVLDVVGVGLPGHRLVVLCPPGPLAEAVDAAGGAVLTGPIGPDAGLHRSAATLRHAVRALRPAVVHSHLSYADIVVALATPRGPRLATTEHGIADDDLVYHGSRAKAATMAQAHRARLRRFEVVLAVSQATADVVRRKWRVAGAVTVIQNGVDPVLRAVPEPGLRVLSLARLAPEKRLHDLVESFALLAADHPAASLTIAGIGGERERLEARVRELDLSSRVRFPGFVPAGPALREADVVAQLSVWENCSYTLLDAMTHGIGVVAARVGGNPEMLPDRCLVDAGDHSEVARLVVEQGLDLAQRPRLPDGWPTVEAMAAFIARSYGVTA